MKEFGGQHGRKNNEEYIKERNEGKGRGMTIAMKYIRDRR
jgi:hypothetical protein